MVISTELSMKNDFFSPSDFSAGWGLLIDHGKFRGKFKMDFQSPRTSQDEKKTII
jgi:hypothetical protein